MPIDRACEDNSEYMYDTFSSFTTVEISGIKIFRNYTYVLRDIGY